MKPKFVLDASGIIRSNLDFSAGGYVTSGSVVSELYADKARDAVDYAVRIGRISLKEPSTASRNAAAEAAARTGDIKALSPADLDVLALALELKIPVVTDDYAIQNTAAELGVMFVATFHPGITERVRWVFSCVGCGREWDAKTKVCSVCGSAVARRKA